MGKVLVAETYCMATRPSMLPTAKPLLEELVKQDTTRVCHFKGDVMVCANIKGVELDM